MNLAQTIQRAEGLIQWLDHQVDGIQFKADKRTAFSAPCFDVAVEHHKAIVLLIANNISGPALSLVRLLFESYIRGLWLFHCASDAEIDRFSDDEWVATFAEMLSAVEKTEGFKSGILSEAKSRSWKAMNSYTHTGMQQVGQRRLDNSVQANYSEDTLIAAVDFSCAIGCLVAIAICDLANDGVRAAAILKKAQELFSSVPKE